MRKRVWGAYAQVLLSVLSGTQLQLVWAGLAFWMSVAYCVQQHVFGATEGGGQVWTMPVCLILTLRASGGWSRLSSSQAIECAQVAWVGWQECGVRLSGAEAIDLRATLALLVRGPWLATILLATFKVPFGCFAGSIKGVAVSYQPQLMLGTKHRVLSLKRYLDHSVWHAGCLCLVAEASAWGLAA
jgi:hypothetical protein